MLSYLPYPVFSYLPYPTFSFVLFFFFFREMSLTRRLPSLDDKTYTGINSLSSYSISSEQLHGLTEDIKGK